MTWKRVVWLEMWMFLFPPAGLWMLWRETSLTRSTKQRMVIYTLLLPSVAYIAVLLYVYNLSEHALQAAGAGF
jgi:hypothetical protein